MLYWCSKARQGITSLKCDCTCKLNYQIQKQLTSQFCSCHHALPLDYVHCFILHCISSWQIWDLNGLVISNLRGHSGHVKGCVFSKDGNLLATASLDYTAKVLPLGV